jgi:S-adenosylmethionine-dependent methyltransferase
MSWRNRKPDRDISFDGRAERFVERIYGSAKGELRLALLWQDMLAEIPPLAGPAPLRIWDAGGGAGQMAFKLAARGHAVLLSDISADMLALAAAQRDTAAAGSGRIEIRCASIQALSDELDERFDLIVCHAVLEWLAQPREVLAQLARRLAPGGYLSLMFYNRHSLLLTHAVRGSVDKLLGGETAGHPGSLTPPNALAPAEVEQWLRELGLAAVSRCGIRTVTEYLPRAQRAEMELETLLRLEQRYCREEPFQSLGRYLHWVCRQPTAAAPTDGS